MDLRYVNKLIMLSIMTVTDGICKDYVVFLLDIEQTVIVRADSMRICYKILCFVTKDWEIIGS